MMQQTLIFIDQSCVQDSIALLEAASRIHGNEACRTHALIIGGDVEPLLGKFDVIIRIQDEKIRNYDQVAVADVVTGLHRQYLFDSIIIPGSREGRMLAPRVAMHLTTGLVADVTVIVRHHQKVQLVRPAYGGRMMACVETTGNGPIMLTVRPGVFQFAGGAIKKTKIVEPENFSYRSGGIRQLHKKKKKQEYDIRKSDVLISAGGGVVEKFEALQPLAKALGGDISASRALVDTGRVSRNIQVGQSGKTVSPRLYMALGIHGAMQHMVGLDDVDYIISVNTNPQAPICSFSDIVVNGDAIIFTSKLLERINRENRG